jgi:hypothetical protein
VAVGNWGILPSEFWKMTLAEWWLIFDVKRPVEQKTHGSMTKSEVHSLYKKAYGEK